MASKKKKTTAVKTPPIKAPWIYINDGSENCYGYHLAALIPSTLQIVLHGTAEPDEKQIMSVIRAKDYEQTVVIISDKRLELDNASKLMTMQNLKVNAIDHGCNFASVHICEGSVLRPFSAFSLGLNHVDITTSRGNVADKIYQWLFSILTVRETLYLIPDSQMREIDTVNFPEYAYCTIADYRKKPKDAKTQFVALILDKPQVKPGRKLTWSVADKTGISTFFFEYRGPFSQATWDWVLSFEPGDRKALASMPMVKIKEKKRLTLIKAPFRATSAVVTGAGMLVTGAGQFLTSIGAAVKLGHRCEWVYEADIDSHGKKANDFQKQRRVTFVTPDVKREKKIFNENGGKMWSDNDSIASTEAGSTCDEKGIADFV